MTLIILADCSSRDFVLLADSYGLLNGIQGQRVTEIQVSRGQLQLRPPQRDSGTESHPDTGDQGTATATASLEEPGEEIHTDSGEEGTATATASF